MINKAQIYSNGDYVRQSTAPNDPGRAIESSKDQDEEKVFEKTKPIFERRKWR